MQILESFLRSVGNVFITEIIFDWVQRQIWLPALQNLPKNPN